MSETSSIPVTAIVLTRNEEDNIDKCLASLQDFETVFVVDSHSEDETRERAARYPNVRVENWTWNGRFPKKKQWAIENLPIATEWILMLDADEEVPGNLASEIEAVARANSSKAAYFVDYDNYFLNRRLRFGSHSMKLIFFRRGAARFVASNEILVDTMWEVEGNYQPEVQGEVGRLKAHAVHHDCKNLYHYFGRHNRYSDLEAVHRLGLEKMAESYPPLRRLLKRLLRRTPGSGFAYFFYSYVLKLGFLDGVPGLAFALARLAYFTQIECKVMELKTDPERLRKILDRHVELMKEMTSEEALEKGPA